MTTCEYCLDTEEITLVEGIALCWLCADTEEAIYG